MSEFTYKGGDGCSLYAITVGAGGPPLVLLHGGGPDHHSLLPLARHLADLHTVILPDVRGYGRSVCIDPGRHTWTQYTSDVIALLDHLGTRDAALGGTGLGATVTLRTALAHPDRVRAAILISVENIEDDQDKQAEIAFLDTVIVDGRVLIQGGQVTHVAESAVRERFIDAAVQVAGRLFDVDRETLTRFTARFSERTRQR
ncbi:alpha/beta fold hydrolase [Nonomuraea sp. NEAU-A123]|uniref:alpha/beta fold hydrolase n=1 Tax=Nonomuraea sp. NEAU-A123 TaxID=2839649 RepID=UPI001BE44455|nr:alpha/beta hydrolase [Nonomuraea sp. NEAU-A123]MBT2231124.1 alpha/beta hydrolase [Nonomuraea sp. NEAU-A123]